VPAWLAAALLLMGCGEDAMETCDRSVGSLAGNAYLGASDPAVGVTLSVAGGPGPETTITVHDASEFNLELAAGPYTVTAESTTTSCKTAQPIPVEVIACETQFVDLALEACEP
jgi:hypothetical protein